MLPAGEKPLFFHAKTEGRGRVSFTKEIQKLKSGGVKPADIAVLYRSHFVTRAIEEVFLKEAALYAL